MSLRALDGFVIGVTADRRWAEQAELLQRRGAAIVHGPTIKTEYLASDEALRSATLTVIDRRPEFFVATTGIGVRAWFEGAQAWGLFERLGAALAETRIVARGPKAAAAMQTAGFSVWEMPDSERLDDVIAALLAVAVRGCTVAFQHYGARNGDAVDTLIAAGADVIEVPIYRWQRPDDERPALRLVDAVCDGRVDAVTFTSAPAVHNLLAMAHEHGRRTALLDAFNSGRAVAACIGPTCAHAARQEGVQQPIAPAHGRLGLLVRTLTDALYERRRAYVMAGRRVVVQGRALCIDDGVVDLPERERAVFDMLLRRRGAVVSKATIVRSLGNGASARALEATVARLRRRMGPAGEAVRSVRSRGYLLDAQPDGVSVTDD